MLSGRSLSPIPSPRTVNYLSHFLLTEKLLGTLLAKSRQPRVVQVSSSFHFAVDGSDLFPTVVRGTSASSTAPPPSSDEDDDEFGTCDTDPGGVCGASEVGPVPAASIPGGSHGFYVYMGQRQYANSKLAQILHARYLARNNNGLNATFTSACPAWVGTAIIRVEQDSLTARAFRAVAFDVDGFGLSSILRAMFSPVRPDAVGEDGPADDYFISTGFFHYGKVIDDYLLEHTALAGDPHSAMTPRTWSYRWLPVRDFAGYLMGMLVLPWQRVWPVLETTKSSRASYDEQLQKDLYEWSYDAVRRWL
jgi:hypothetical protein